MHIAVARQLEARLFRPWASCATRLTTKRELNTDIVKTGRTHLQDAHADHSGPGNQRLGRAGRFRLECVLQACRESTTLPLAVQAVGTA